MKISALALTFPVPGVGRLTQTEHRHSTLAQAFGREWPVNGGDWQRKLRRLRQRPARGTRPQDFQGWMLAGERCPLNEFVVYETMEAVAAAINEGSLRPCGPPGLLAQWGLISRGRASKTGLAKNASLLRSLTLIPMQFLAKAGFIEAGRKIPTFLVDLVEDSDPLPEIGRLVETSEPKGLKFVEQVGHAGWNGLLRIVAVPALVRVGVETVVRRARWVAQFPRPQTSLERWPYPFLTFDGLNLSFISTLDELHAGFRRDLERSGEFLVVQQTKLLPPTTLRARYVFSVEQATSPEGAEDDTTYSSLPDQELPRRLVGVSAVAAVPISSRGVIRLNDKQARIAWELHSEKVGLSKDVAPRKHWDLLLCDRQSPFAGTTADAHIVRQTNLFGECI
jgi:hypothetical protein